MRQRSLILGLMLVLGAVAGCDRVQPTSAFVDTKPEEKKQEKQEKEAEVIIPVQAEFLHRGDISSHFETTTRVEAEDRVQVTAEAIGICLNVHVQEGDHVNAGQILAELDKKEAQATLGQTEVRVRQCKTSLDIAERSLVEGIGAKAERDNAQFAYEQAVATFDMQKVQFDKLTIRAPIAGVVTKKSLQEGQVVAMGVPVFIIVDPASFMLAINVPERELPRLNVGQVAKVTVDALGDQEFEARVRRVNPGVESSSGTVKVTLDLDKETREKLREAAFARVRLVMETHENALLAPKDALVEENARKYLFTAKENEAKQTPAAETVSPASDAAKPETEEPSKPIYVASRAEVQTGLEDSNSIEILSGVDDSLRVVTLGQHTLKPGSLVTITNADSEIHAKTTVNAEDALKAAKEKRAGQAEVKKTLNTQHRQHRHP